MPKTLVRLVREAEVSSLSEFGYLVCTWLASGEATELAQQMFPSASFETAKSKLSKLKTAMRMGTVKADELFEFIAEAGALPALRDMIDSMIQKKGGSE